MKRKSLRKSKRKQYSFHFPSCNISLRAVNRKQIFLATISSRRAADRRQFFCIAPTRYQNLKSRDSRKKTFDFRCRGNWPSPGFCPSCRRKILARFLELDFDKKSRLVPTESCYLSFPVSFVNLRMENRSADFSLSKTADIFYLLID